MTEMLLKKKQIDSQRGDPRRGIVIFSNIDIRAFLDFLAFEKMGGQSAPRHR
jgi:hypothetical protein